MLTRKQHELICFIADRLNETGVSPSFEEMKDALDLKSKSGVHRLISALEERGFLRRLPNRARALEVVKMPERGEAKKAAPASAVSLVAPKAPRHPGDPWRLLLEVLVFGAGTLAFAAAGIGSAAVALGVLAALHLAATFPLGQRRPWPTVSRG